MPLVELNKTGEQCGWAIWKIAETEAQLAGDILGSIPTDITHAQKRLEWFAARTLTLTLSNYLGLRYFGISKNEAGKPSLEKYSHRISLSHSYPYVAVQIDKFKSVGIDIEQPKEKLLKIAPRVLSSHELVHAGQDIVKHCVYWCAKEALFKLDGKGGLHFSIDLKIESFELRSEGLLKGWIKERDVELAYQVNKDFVIVYTSN